MDIPCGGLAPATLDATAPGITAHLLPLSPVGGKNFSVAFLKGTVIGTIFSTRTVFPSGSFW